MVGSLERQATFKSQHMKPLITAVVYAAIVTQSEGCDIIKKLTGKEWPDVPVGTKRMFVISGVVLAWILFMIARYLLTSRTGGLPEGRRNDN